MTSQWSSHHLNNNDELIYEKKGNKLPTKDITATMYSNYCIPVDNCKLMSRTETVTLFIT